MGLSFRVRNGTGRFPHAMTAVTLLPGPPAVAWGWEIWCYNCAVLPDVLMLQTCCVTAVVLFVFSCWFASNGFVGWEPHSGRGQSCYLFTSPGCKPLLKDWFAGVVCGVSYRPISTGQLHESLVLASTSGLSTQWSGWGPLTQKCMEISSRSELPA